MSTSAASSLALSQAGPGLLVIGGANTYFGPTTVSGGVLAPRTPTRCRPTPTCSSAVAAWLSPRAADRQVADYRPSRHFERERGQPVDVPQCGHVRRRHAERLQLHAGHDRGADRLGSHANPGSDAFLSFTVDGSNSTGYQLEYQANELEIAPVPNTSMLVPSTSAFRLRPRAIDGRWHAARNRGSFRRHDQHRGHGRGVYRRFARSYDHVGDLFGARLHHRLAELDRQCRAWRWACAHGDTVVIQNTGNSGTGPTGTAGPPPTGNQQGPIDVAVSGTVFRNARSTRRP